MNRPQSVHPGGAAGDSLTSALCCDTDREWWAMLRTGRRTRWWAAVAVPLVAALLGAPLGPVASAQEAGPRLTDPDLTVRAVATGLQRPTSMVFLDRHTVLVTEKDTGRVQVVTPSAATATATRTVAIDLAVNNASERGLLGITKHPDFPRVPHIYLYWTRSLSGMTTGRDSSVPQDVELLGNRVDRFRWHAATRTLTFDKAIVQLRARQHDPTNVTVTPATPTATSTATRTVNVVERGNHNGGKMAFGLDGTLYIEVGDVGRRGQTQNLPDGPGCSATPTVDAAASGAVCPPVPQGNLPDDQYGGPEPDDAHLTGVILRLNADGTTPGDNPFVQAGRERGGEVGSNWKKVYAYGVRNAFGMAVDPYTGRLWDAQNGDDAFSEINRIPAGANLGWVQAMGPLSRVGQFKAIETTRVPDPPDPRAPADRGGYYGLQQARFDPARLADSPREARARMFDVHVGAKDFAATLSGAEEVPANTSGATGRAVLRLRSDRSLDYSLSVEQISEVRAAHIHLGARGQNGPVVVTLFDAATSTVSTFDRQRIASGRITAADITARPPGLDGTPAELLRRLRQGRAYVNVHTVRLPAGEIRGQVVATDGRRLSHYVDPQLSWTYEVAPVGLGFHTGYGLGKEYRGNAFVGQAIPVSEGGRLFRLQLSADRERIIRGGPQLADRVADNVGKYGTQQSEPLLFGSRFGAAVDIRTGPNRNLYVLSLTDATFAADAGTLYEIRRR